MRTRLPVLAGALALSLVGAGVLAPSAFAADVAPAMELHAETILPPGQSGFFRADGQAQYQVSGDPAAFGPHVDDDRVPYWNGEYKPGNFATPTGTPETPAPGVRLYRDPQGVPLVYGDTGYDVWFGAGYAAGQDRLFLADAVRRLGNGTFAALTGASGVPLDVQARTLTYSQADYDAMFAALPPASKDAITGYAQGMDAWITKVLADPTLLPAEYQLLSALPEHWTVTDTLAAGVLITRSVASAGGEEFDETAELRALVGKFGAAAGLGAFSDLSWNDDRNAVATIPAADGLFSNNPTPPAQRPAVLKASSDYALGLPMTLASGPGTGAYPAPDPTPLPTGSAAAPSAADIAARAVDSLRAFGEGLHGGSYQIAVSGSRTASGKPLLESAPQLGYSYPTQLWQLEVHGGGYDARGVSVPGLPTVGIGYGKRVAWALTTGTSKTIDSFIETTRRVDGKLEYRHDGTWKPADCRTEQIDYRAAVSGAPVGPAVQNVQVEVCRTVHGPIVATDAGSGLARSVSLAMYGRELETINGILAWNRAQNLAEFTAGVAQVTWNENVMYADADGHIAYWHPGLFPARSPGVDSRFPARGDGSQDWSGFLPFSAMPHVVDPAQGWLANWNTKPAVGWTDTYLDAVSARPSGPASRYSNIADQLAANDHVTFADLKAIDFRAGTMDTRYAPLRPLLAELRSTAGLTATETATLDALLAWDGTAYGPGAGTSAGQLTDATVTDGPAPTAFRRFADEVRREVLRDLPAGLSDGADVVSGHLFEATPADNLVLRILRPGYSSLTPSRDYLGGRTPVEVVRAALARTLAGLTTDYGSDLAAWRDPHPRTVITSLTGVIGPSVTMPFQDRGSWIHLVDFAGAAAAGSPTPAAGGGVAAGGSGGAGTGGALATTGGGALSALAGLLLVSGSALVRRRRALRPSGRSQRRRGR